MITLDKEVLEDEIVDIVQGKLAHLGILSCEHHDPAAYANSQCNAILDQLFALLKVLYGEPTAPVRDEFGRFYAHKIMNGKIVRVMIAP